MTALLLRGSRPSLWQLQRLPAACIHSRISGRGHLAARTCADGATTGLTSTSVARAGHLQARDERSVASLITGNVDTTLRSLETMLGPMDPSHTVSATRTAPLGPAPSLQPAPCAAAPRCCSPCSLVPWYLQVPPPKPVVVVVSGPSGVGKDTVVARLKEQREDLYFVVTATSRYSQCRAIQPSARQLPRRRDAAVQSLSRVARCALCRPKRSSEVEGRDYFFVTREKFEEWIAQDMLLEHALVYGDYKGIPRQQVSANAAPWAPPCCTRTDG